MQHLKQLNLIIENEVPKVENFVQPTKVCQIIHHTIIKREQ